MNSNGYNSYEFVKKFMSKYPMTVAWRVKSHCKVLDKFLYSGEKVLYAFPGQKNDRSVDLFNTYVLAFTNRRILVATKRVLFGYFIKSITPDMYNDLTIHKGIIWGKLVLDTVKEVMTITNIDARALSEVEANITEIMIKNKKEYVKENDSKK